MRRAVPPQQLPRVTMRRAVPRQLPRAWVGAEAGRLPRACRAWVGAGADGTAPMCWPSAPPVTIQAVFKSFPAINKLPGIGCSDPRISRIGERACLAEKQAVARRPFSNAARHFSTIRNRRGLESEACVVLCSIALEAAAAMTRLISESWFFLGSATVTLASKS